MLYRPYFTRTDITKITFVLPKTYGKMLKYGLFEDTSKLCPRTSILVLRAQRVNAPCQKLKFSIFSHKSSLNGPRWPFNSSNTKFLVLNIRCQHVEYGANFEIFKFRFWKKGKWPTPRWRLGVAQTSPNILYRPYFTRNLTEITKIYFVLPKTYGKMLKYGLFWRHVKTKPSDEYTRPPCSTF